jgi:2-polyprenyl-6-methoxyphenol hydroxylase-like FAD-dependent oxidoreductase
MMQTRIPARRVIVAGGSIAGLLAGALLHRLGFAVDVFERSGEALASRGAGIMTHPELFDVLAQAGAACDENIGVPIAGRITLDRDGTVLGEHPLLQLTMSWDRLYRVVRATLPEARQHAGRAVAGFNQDEDGVNVYFMDGASERADWLIGADGIRSTVRRRLLPNLEPAYAGYVAWRGLIEERRMSAAARALLCDRLAFCLPAGEWMLGYPIPGADEAIEPGRRRYNVVWYRPADEAVKLPLLLTGRDTRSHDVSIPPGQVAHQAVAELYDDADVLLAPCCAEVVRLSHDPFIQAIYDFEGPRLVFGRVILIGDAAFLARPHAGMGATKAARDALTLARALASADPAAALPDWERRRLRYGHALVERARRLGLHLSQRAAGPAAWSTMAKELSATLMAETAISGWLHE